MQSLDIKELSIWNIILSVLILVAIVLMLYFNSKITNTLDQHNQMLAVQAGSIANLEAKIKDLEKENVELKQTLSLYSEENFKKLLITISEHDRKIDLLNETIKKLY